MRVSSSPLNVISTKLLLKVIEHNNTPIWLILAKFQSGFQRYHSTEAALLKVINDLLLAVDNSRCSVLVLPDLSAAFHTVDHSILLKRLKDWVVTSGTILDWFTFYL